MTDFWPLLVLAALAAVGVVVWRRFGAPAPGIPEPKAPADELRSLGLTAPRPRAETSPLTNSAARPVQDARQTAAEPGSVIRDLSAWGDHGAAVVSLMDAFAATLGGPVAVLSIADGVASVDALAEPDGAPRLPQRRLSAERTAALADGATDALVSGDAAGDALRAFRSVTADAPDAAAARRLGASRLLVVGGALDSRTLALADRYADLLAALAPDTANNASTDATAAPTENTAPTVTETAPTVETEEHVLTAEMEDMEPSAPVVPLSAARPESTLELVDLSAEEPTAALGSESHHAPVADESPSHARPGLRAVAPAEPVPRAVLLAAQVASARDAGRPLAFALLTRADAEAALADGDAEAATVALCTEVALADEVERAEPFGDLVVGAFLDTDPDGARAWADGLEAGAFRVGLVLEADYDAETLRADAEEALRRAWVEDQAVIVAEG